MEQHDFFHKKKRTEKKVKREKEKADGETMRDGKLNNKEIRKKRKRYRKTEIEKK